MINDKNLLTTEEKHNLCTAYMELCAALENVFKQIGYSVGESYYNTGVVMGEMLRGCVDAINAGDARVTPAIRYIVRLYNVHKRVLAKKSMLVPNKDEINYAMIAATAEPCITPEQNRTLVNLADRLIFLFDMDEPDLSKLQQSMEQHEVKKFRIQKHIDIVASYQPEKPKEQTDRRHKNFQKVQNAVIASAYRQYNTYKQYRSYRKR